MRLALARQGSTEGTGRSRAGAVAVGGTARVCRVGHDDVFAAGGRPAAAARTAAAAAGNTGPCSRARSRWR